MDADQDGIVSGEEVVQHVQKMEAELAALTKSKLDAQIKAADELKRTQDERDQLTTELEKLTKDKKELHAVYTAAEEEGAQRETELEALNKAKAELQTAHDVLKKELSEAGTALKKMTKQNKTGKLKMKLVEEDLAEVEAEWTKTQQRLAGVEAELENANQSIVTLLKQSEDKLQVPHTFSLSLCSMS